MSIDEAQKIWQAALGELSLQMAKATFDAWLRGSRVVEVEEEAEGGTRLVVWVRHVHAVEWLENRLRPLIERTMGRHGDLGIRFTARAMERPSPAGEEGRSEPGPEAREGERERPALSPGVAELAAVEPREKGWWKVGNYETIYWGAYLGAAGWRVYEILMQADRRRTKTTWTPFWRFTVSDLARMAGCSRQKIRGRWRRITTEGQDSRMWMGGVFDRLVEAGVGWVAWHTGNLAWQDWLPGGVSAEVQAGRRGLRMVYRMKAVTRLPVLTPLQEAELPAALQVRHQRALAELGVDVDAWEGLAIYSLAELTE